MRIITDIPVWRRPAVQRLAWFVGLWAAGVLSIGAAAMALRWVLHA